MARLRRFLSRLRSVFRPFEAEADLAREVDSHLRLMEDDFERQGFTPEQARLAARRKFGGVEQTKDRHRDARSFVWMDDVRRDINYAVRTAQRSPGFALLGVAVMALGIGANTAIFSVVNTVLLKPLPYRDPDRIVTISTAGRTGAPSGLLGRQIADADFLDWRRQATRFEAMAYYGSREAAVMAGEQAEYARVSRVSGDFFGVFGVRPIAGRLFDPEELTLGTNGAAVVSCTFAESHFGGSAEAIGRTIRVFNRPVTIVGVAPLAFDFPDSTEIWAPLTVPDAANPLRRGGRNFQAVGRLKTGVNLEQAQSEMTTIARRLEQQYPDTNTGRSVEVERLRDHMVGDVRLMLYVLLATVGLVQLIACTNLATLLLVRATARAQEMTVRAALGAGRGRIVRQMLVEGLVQGLVAGVSGLALAFGGMRVLIAIIPANVPRVAEIALDGRVLFFTLTVSVVSSVLLALVPAFQASQVHLESGLRKGDTRSIGGSRTRRLRDALMVAQLAMAVVLLASGGLLIRSFFALQNVALGFQPQNVLVIDATVATPDPREGASLFFRDLLREMSNAPGVVAVGATMAPPGRVDSTSGYWVDHVPQPSELRNGPSGVLSIVAPGTFKALGIPLVSGREFDDSDVGGAPMTAIVNEALARQTLAGKDPIGHKIVCTFDTAEPMTIVGVVGNVRQAGPAKESQPECYMPYLQHFYNGATLSLVIRTAADPMSLAETVRRKAQELTPGVPVKFTTLDTLTAQNVAAPRFRAMLIGVFAVVALVLAIIGVFGVTAYAVSHRTREVGMRLALGATRSHILRLFLGRGVALTMTGLALGLIGAAMASRVFAGLLFATKPIDPTTYLLVSILLGFAALLALYLPARRATEIDPLVALRYE